MRAGIGDDAMDGCSNLLGETFGHPMPCLAKRDSQNPRIGFEVVNVIADAQCAALAVNVAGERLLDTGFAQHAGEHLSRNRAHVAASSHQPASTAWPAAKYRAVQ